MSRLIFYIKNYKINLKMNLFIIIQLVFMLLIVNANVSDVMYLRNTAYYCKEVPQNIYFLSGATKGSVLLGDVAEFYSFVDELNQSSAILDVGYQLEDGVYIKDEDDQVIPYIYLNSTMQEIEYPLKKGEWFSKSTKDDRIQIVIGGEIGKRYKVGETIRLLDAIKIDNKIEYREIDAEIIGILKDPSYVINLGVSASRPTYNNLYDEYQNVILSNSDIVIDYDGVVRYPLGSVTVKLDDDADKDSITKYGQLFSFNDIEENSKTSYFKNIMNKLPSVLIIIAAVVFGLVGTTYLYVYRYMKTTTIYYLTGLSKKKCQYLITSNNLISLIVAVIVSILLLLFNEELRESLFARNPIGVANIVITLGFAMVVALISNIASKHFSKDTIYMALRRFQ
ncbi:MAG: hypothetical protein IJE43_11995 [Alphaproteobacteria bacterium]|nr:hypothetical protein [Alphaproteobacteria bacterium]